MKHLLSSLFLLWILSSPHAIASTYDTASGNNSGTSTSATSLSWSHTVTCSGGNRVLIVCMHERNSTDTTTPDCNVTYNGVSMTDNDGVQFGGSNRNRVEYFHMTNPPCGSAYTVAATCTNTNNLEGGAISATNVNQTTPLGTIASLTSGTSQTFSVTPTTTSGDLVVGCVTYLTSDTSSMAPNGGETERYEEITSSPATGAGQGQTEVAAGATTDIAWTCTAACYKAAIAFSVNTQVYVPPSGHPIFFGFFRSFNELFAPVPLAALSAP